MLRKHLVLEILEIALISLRGTILASLALDKILEGFESILIKYSLVSPLATQVAKLALQVDHLVLEFASWDEIHMRTNLFSNLFNLFTVPFLRPELRLHPVRRVS